MGCQLETAVQGDVNDSRLIALIGGGDIADDLPTATWEGHVWQEGGATTILTVTLVDAARKIIAVNLGGSSGWLAGADPGNYLLEYQCTFTDGRIWTWPSGAPDRITVRAEAP